MHEDKKRQYNFIPELLVVMGFAISLFVLIFTSYRISILYEDFRELRSFYIDNVTSRDKDISIEVRPTSDDYFINYAIVTIKSDKYIDILTDYEYKRFTTDSPNWYYYEVQIPLLKGTNSYNLQIKDNYSRIYTYDFEITKTDQYDQSVNSEDLYRIEDAIVQDSISFTPIILDEKTRITADYKPQDMLDISNIGVNASKDTYLDYDAALALLNMQQALLDSDINVQVTSAYRSFQSQIYTYDFYVTNRGEEFAKKQVAPPGHSEHQLGLAVDLVNEETNYRLPSEGQTTQLYDWLIENASDYGFYQTFDQSQTEYREEIWHWRYIDD